MSEFFQVKFITLKMEGCCSFKSLVGGVCGCDPKDRNRWTEIVPLVSCDISSINSPGLKMRLI